MPPSLSVEPILGLREGGLARARRVQLGPAHRQAQGDRTRRQPQVARRANALHVVDRPDLVGLGEDRREPSRAEPGNPVDFPGVSPHRRRNGRDQPIGGGRPEALDEAVKPIDLHEHDRRRSAVAAGPRILLVEPAGPRRRGVEPRLWVGRDGARPWSEDGHLGTAAGPREIGIGTGRRATSAAHAGTHGVAPVPTVDSPTADARDEDERESEDEIDGRRREEDDEQRLRARSAGHA